MSDAGCGEAEWMAEVLHALSQPVTALECGLELSLRQDMSAEQLRARLVSLLEAAQLLHQRMMELGALQQAGEAGDTTSPVDLGGVLAEVQADLAPVAESKQVAVQTACDSARVRGNSARLRDGIFHLLDFLLRTCPKGGMIFVSDEREPDDVAAAGFRVIDLIATTSDAGDGVSWRDWGWRLAQRTFRAAGGELVAGGEHGGQIRVRMSLRRA